MSQKRRNPVSNNEQHSDSFRYNKHDDDDRLASLICWEFDERKVHVVKKTVEVLGQDKTIEVVKQTRQVLATGAMWVKDRSRKRRPGGVFFTLIREHSDPEISGKYREIKASDTFREKQRRRLRRQRKHQRQAMQQEEDQHGPDTQQLKESGGRLAHSGKRTAITTQERPRPSRESTAREGPGFSRKPTAEEESEALRRSTLWKESEAPKESNAQGSRPSRKQTAQEGCAEASRESTIQKVSESSREPTVKEEASVLSRESTPQGSEASRESTTKNGSEVARESTTKKENSVLGVSTATVSASRKSTTPKGLQATRESTVREESEIQKETTVKEISRASRQSPTQEETGPSRKSTALERLTASRKSTTQEGLGASREPTAKEESVLSKRWYGTTARNTEQRNMSNSLQKKTDTKINFAARNTQSQRKNKPSKASEKRKTEELETKVVSYKSYRDAVILGQKKPGATQTILTRRRTNKQFSMGIKQAASRKR